MTEYAFEGFKRASTTVTWSFASQTYAADAAFPFSTPISSQYQATIQAAFARWASVAGITFVQTADSPTDDIRVGFGIFNTANAVGNTIYRAPTGYLSQDTIVRLLDPVFAPVSLSAQGTYYYSYYEITLYQVALHEIGHALGLDHSTDPRTLMYPVATSLNTDLARGDIEGLNTLYPLYTVAANNPVQVESPSGTAYSFTVTRYSDPATALTVDYSVTGAAYPGLAGTVAASAADFAGGTLPTGQLTFAARSTTATLSIAVPGTTIARPDQAFAISITSADPSTIATTHGAVDAVILDANGYSAITAGALGIYRFFDQLNGTHFFTASEAERNALIIGRPDMTYEGVDLTAVGTPASDPAAVAVYRFFDTAYGTHFYTASATERDAVLATRPDLTLEGTAFYEDATQLAGDTAVYRFFDTGTGTHFYTSSATERATILATRPDLSFEGTAFYAPAAA